MLNKFGYISIAVFFLLLLQIFLFSLDGYFNTCLSQFDISIYQEAIFKIAHSFDLNPFLNMREIKILNDHFDPIIYMAAPFVWVFGYSPLSLLIFQNIWPILSALLIYWYHKGDKAKVGLCLFILIFSRGLTGGLIFPLHPVTWSVFPLLLLIYFLKAQNDKGIVFTGLALLLFKETYPFAVLGLSFFFFFKKKWRVFIPLFTVSLLWLYFLYFLREPLLGEVYPHSKRITNALFSDIFGFIKYRIFEDFNFKDFFNLFLPFLIPMIILFKNEIKNIKGLKDHFILPVAFFFVPILGIHVIANFWFNWNGVFFSTVLGGILFFSGLPEFVLKRKKLLIIILIPFLITGIKFHEKAFKLLVLKKSKTCSISDTKTKSLKESREIIKKLDNDLNIYATSGYIPWILKPWKRVFPLGGGEWSIPKRRMDVLVFERNHHGFITPHTPEKIESWINMCKKDNNILFMDEYVTVLKGPFEQTCVDDIFLSFTKLK